MANTLYLLNNKDYEPDLPKHVRTVVEAHRGSFQELDIANCSFFCPRRSSEPMTVWSGIKPLEISRNDYVFVRKWHPNSPASILFTCILREWGVPHTEEAMNRQHTALQSKLTQPFQLKGVANFPDTWVATPEAFEINKDRILHTFTFPIVLKLKGAESKRVWKCDTQDALTEKIYEVTEQYAPKLLMLQEYIPNDFDIRVILWRGNVLATLKRASQDGFLTNKAKGVGVEAIELTLAEETLAHQAAAKLGFELAGVDIVRSEHGPLLFEVNKTPDIAQYNEAAGFNIEEKIIEDILSSD